jgi:hypothetical protein
MKDLKDLVSHLVVLKASQVALTAIPSKYPDGYRCNFDISFNNCEGEKTIDGWKRRDRGERGYYVVARKKIPSTTTITT